MIKKLYFFLFVHDWKESAVSSIPVQKKPLKTKLLQDFTFLVLGVYVYMIFRAVLPILADGLAHTFWEKEHLAAVHQSSGKNHLENEISKIEKPAEQNKAGGSIKLIVEDYVLILRDGVLTLAPNDLIIENNYPEITLFCPSAYPDKDIPPPKVKV